MAWICLRNNFGSNGRRKDSVLMILKSDAMCYLRRFTTVDIKLDRLKANVTRLGIFRNIHSF